MSMPALFSSCNLFAMAGWALLVLAPRWRWTERLVLSGAWSLALSAVYLALVAAYMPGAAGGFGSLAEVKALFAHDGLLLAGWVHYLAFDLLVGALVVRRAREEGLPHLAVVPILVFTFLLGPVGLLLFAAALSVRARRAAPVLARG
jgi:hypothetical protein